MSFALLPTDALLIIDLQNRLLPARGSGKGEAALAVAGGDEIVSSINALARRFDHVLLTQDWHPTGHISFASTHPGAQPFQTIGVPYGAQTLWPDHCLQHSEGAAFHPEVDDVPCMFELYFEKRFQAGYRQLLRLLGENDHAKTSPASPAYLPRTRPTAPLPLRPGL